MTRAIEHALGTRAALALRRLPAARARLWLVRPDLAEAAAALGLVLLRHLPDVLVGLGWALVRNG